MIADWSVRGVHAFAVFPGRAPATATAGDLRRFQLHRHESGVATGLQSKDVVFTRVRTLHVRHALDIVDDQNVMKKP
jgi:hypothetical protein